MYRQKITLVLALCVLAACEKSPAPMSVSESTELATAPAIAASNWPGRWTGPEGTYLEIVQDGQTFSVAIRNLDGVRTFEAVSIELGLSFERDGTTETITAGSGKDTGMKWLQDKSNCLVVSLGEGYCR